MDIKQLTVDEQLSLRDDFKEKEREIQKYIGIYLSSIVVAAGWFLRPNSAPLIDLAIGNFGYNAFAVLSVIGVNLLFTCFLIYKSLIIHEIMQFVTVFSPPDSRFAYWDWWRDSKYSATYRVRTVYTSIIALLPLFVSGASMSLLFNVVFTQSSELVDSSAAEQLEGVFLYVRVVFWIVAVLHVIPIWFFLEQIFPTRSFWKEIHDSDQARELGEYVSKVLRSRTSQNQGPKNLSRPSSSGTRDELDPAEVKSVESKDRISLP